MEGSMAGTGKASRVAAAAFIVCLAGLAPTATMAQIPFPMVPNFNFGPQHYRSGPSHYSTRSSTRSRSRHDEDRAPDKTKEKDATQPDTSATASAQRQQQTSGPPRDTAPPAGSTAAAGPPPSPPPAKSNDDQPAFQPSR
jgi:hypothetical protein